MAGIRNDQTYRGRFKGTTETHMPNDKTREAYDRMKLGSHVVVCETCDTYGFGTRRECQIWRCPNCNRHGQVSERAVDTNGKGND